MVFYVHAMVCNSMITLKLAISGVLGTLCSSVTMINKNRPTIQTS